MTVPIDASSGAAGAGGSLTAQLAQRLARPVDARSRARAVLHWIDWIGCVAAGARAPVGGVVRRWPGVGGPAAGATACSLLGPASDLYHALVQDAAPANVEEMDDMHREAILHPGPAVLPVLAALARTRGLAAHQVLDGVVRGYEAMARIGRALGPHHYRFWHNTATAGAFGAAAAGASALGLNQEQTVWALGNAGTQATGLWQVRFEPVMSKQLHTAHAAWSGLTAATLAQSGFTGPQYILEGPRGLFAAMCDGGDGAQANPGAVMAPEDDWLIHGTSFKPWPACRHTHATIDCVLALRAAQGGGPMEFASARVESFADAIAICDNPRPTTRTEAKFSLQYVVAAAAALGPLEPTHFDDDVFTRDALRDAAARVSLAVSPTHQADYPAHYGARVVLTLADGRVLRHEVRDSLGDPELALAPVRVLQKARMLMSYGGVAPARRDAALNAAHRLLDGGGMDVAFPRELLDPLFTA
ncbi:MmgE/PrpD family protein [Ramlibacter sp.]|uniref:MmgE/PrpD family protein n=1 Tax=Ramlibacter sp. TaxID=1917967 RepID=UPI0035B48F5F